MVEGTLWIRRAVCGAVMGLLALGVASCREDEKPIGMTLLFQSAARPVVVQRFDPDGMRGPVPGAVSGMSPRFGKQMTFMPGDSKHGVPRFVDVAWVVPTDEFKRWVERRTVKKGGISTDELANRRAEHRERWSSNPHYEKRINLESVISSELVAQVRSNNQNTLIKLTVTFNNDEVDIKAEADKWR